MIKRTWIVPFFLWFSFVFLLEPADAGPYLEKAPAEEEKAEPSGKTPCMPPKITYLVTDYGKPGDTIHIKGRRFGLEKGKVTFNDIPAEVLTWRMETIYVKVPDQAMTGPVIVNNGCADSNSKIFTVGPPPPRDKTRGTTWPW